MHCRVIPNFLFVQSNTYCLSTCGVKKRNYMTYLLGFNIVACAWRLFLHVKVNIMLADRR